MEWWLIGLLLGGLLLIFLLSGQPIPFILGFLAVVGVFFFWKKPQAGFYTIMAQGFSQGSNFLLFAVPMFILVAELFIVSELHTDAFTAINNWAGKLPGSLGVAVLALGTFFAAVTGSSLANAAIMGKVSIPTMEKKGYSRSLAGGTVAAGGTLGIIIPPSIPLIFYGLFSEESIGKLFIAGVIPGLIISFMMMSYVVIRAWMDPKVAPREPFLGWKNAINGTFRIIPLILVAAFMFVGFYFGLATPSEIGAIGAFLAFIIGLLYRRLSWPKLKHAFLATIHTTVLLMWILIGALAFGQVLTYTQVLQNLVESVAALPVSPFVILLAINLFLFIVGCILETGTIIMVISPMLIAIARSLNFDLIWFGILFVINLELALITPPVGFNLFIMKSIAPQISLIEIYRGVIPYIMILILGLVLIIAFPQLVLWLPSTMWK
jgi:C4-dicarboxylate transporter DctM subunit